MASLRIIACTAAVWAMGAAPSLAAAMPPRIQKVAEALVPLPLRYSSATSPDRAGDDTMAILAQLVQPDDRIVIMLRNGEYCVFTLTAGNQAVPEMIPKPKLAETFGALTGRYRRIWVVLVDALAGWQAQPPAAYARIFNSQYAAIPMPLPVFYTDRSAPLGSTTSLLVHASLMERVAALSPQTPNARFHLELGNIYRQFGNVSNALHAYEKGLQQFPDDSYLYRRIADCYFTSLSNYEKAIEYNLKANFCHKQQYGRPMYEALFSAAMSYQRVGELIKARLQYNDILSSIDEFPDAVWESRTRRYLGNVCADSGLTNEALHQFRLDVRLTAQNPSYSYQRLLDMLGGPDSTNDLAVTAREFFLRCGTNDPTAVLAYISLADIRQDKAQLAEAVSTTRGWLGSNRDLLRRLHSRADWWRPWSNAAVRCGLTPEP